ncbi:hypothetical protein KQH61_04290 [bacterium]|nr:hypothetical protein [bacterium]MCB2179123.1 hypothetical protein [bacterium]
MPRKTAFLWMVVLSLMIAALACNLPTTVNNTTQADAQDTDENSPNTENTGNDIQPAPTETVEILEAEPETGLFNDTELADACSIVTPQMAETVLGQAVDAVPGPGVCVYSTGMASINVGVVEGEAAKNGLASQVLMLETDCSMSFSYSSDMPDPTPLPPEADPLLALSLPELMERSLTAQENCGGYAFETMSEYGPGIYLTPYELMMPGGQISIAGEDYTLTILYVDMEKTPEESVEIARQILTLMFGE